jgi:hypothetical protein
MARLVGQPTQPAPNWRHVQQPAAPCMFYVLHLSMAGLDATHLHVSRSRCPGLDQCSSCSHALYNNHAKGWQAFLQQKVTSLMHRLMPAQQHLVADMSAGYLLRGNCDYAFMPHRRQLEPPYSLGLCTAHAGTPSVDQFTPRRTRLTSTVRFSVDCCRTAA